MPCAYDLCFLVFFTVFLENCSILLPFMATEEFHLLKATFPFIAG